MKSNLLRKSGLALLIVAGAMVPVASSAEEVIQYGHQATGTAMERGDQGAIRTDSMDSSPSYKGGDMYSELQNIQSSRAWSASERGAQGPVRTERMDSSPSYKGGNMYDELKNIQRSE